MTIPLFRPETGAEEAAAVATVLTSGWLGKGAVVAEFERRFAAYTGYRHCVTTNSCTAALHLALEALNVRGHGVIVPTWTFASDAHAVTYAGAHPVFADVDPQSLAVTFGTVADRYTNHTAAVIAVHVGGAAIQTLGCVCSGLPMVEDCAHSIGATFPDGRRRGPGIISCYSFHAVKAIACGDGGALCTDEDDIADYARRMSWLGIDKSTYQRTTEQRYTPDYEIPAIGWKCHWNDIAAAVGLAQLAKLDTAIACKRAVARLYDDALGIVTPARDTSAHHLYIVRVSHRDELREKLTAAGIVTGVHYKPLHRMACYRPYRPAPCPVADAEYPMALSLPMFAGMTAAQVETVCNIVRPHLCSP